MKKIVWLLHCALLCLGCYQVQASQQDPLQVMQQITQRVELQIKNNRQKIAQNSKIVHKIIEQEVLPQVDFVEMSKWLAGRSVWGTASVPEQAAFIKEFKILVIRTYASTLSKYNDETIEFLPRQASASRNRVQIASKIHRPGKEDIRVDYRLLLSNDTWKLYDIIVEGVSLLKGFQAQFSEQIRQQGLAAVTKTIKSHNDDKNR